MTVLAPVAAGVTDLSSADPGLNTQAGGTLLTSSQTDKYTFTVTAAQGNGRLTAALTPLLVLDGSDGKPLVQSTTSLVPELEPRSYSLSVSSLKGSGAYTLTTTFVPIDSVPLSAQLPPVSTNAGLPLDQQATGSYPRAVVRPTSTATVSPT